MIELTPEEARVIGVLIEKELTTPDQYPLTVNSLVNACNQKNNRDPITSFDDLQVRAALVGLRTKQLVVQVDGPGQRSSKFRHSFGNTTGLTKPEVVILAELLLRGPQTQGELRGRASRMHPLESLDIVRNTLEQLMARPEPLVRQLPPSPGSRAERYAQLLCPDLHPLDAVGEMEDAAATEDAAAAPLPGAQPTAGQRIAKLEREVQTLRDALRKLAAQIGAEDPLPPVDADGDDTASDSAGAAPAASAAPKEGPLAS